MNISHLRWSPIYKILEERIASGDDILLIVAPYIKLGALERLHSFLGQEKQLKIISRWTLPDLAGGASDLAVYPYLRDRNCEFYIHPSIHLKLYVFCSNFGFVTSGNLTDSGLGYRDPGNVELGALVPLMADDWRSLYALIGDSHRVDDNLFFQMEEHLRSLPPQRSITWPGMVLPPRKTFTIASLPAFETPVAFQAFCFAPDKAQYTPEELRRAAHDLVLFRVPDDLKEAQFNDVVGTNFKSVPFVVHFVEYIKRQRTLRFGAVNDWIHERCEDVPLPYKWDVKTNTRILYNWLAYFYPEIDWDIPGQRSQVISWHDSRGLSTAKAVVQLSHYQNLFSNLTNREGGTEWDGVAVGGAPHQPLLLLAVMAMYDRQPGRPNRIELNHEIHRLFSHYFSLVVDPPHPTSPVMPFMALRDEPFWHLIERPGLFPAGPPARSQATFDQLYEAATLDEPLHYLLRSSESRAVLQQTIIRTYFGEPTRTKLSRAVP